MPRLRFEVCVDSVESAESAQLGGADRVELCSALGEGGLTPSFGLMEVVRSRLRIPIAAMIRPRAGDFCITPAEFDVMKRDLLGLKERGADMLVFGLLLPDGSIDTIRTRELIALARPLPVTFHRAFDMTQDPRCSLETLIDLGCERVLTSGQEKSVLEGLDLLSELLHQAGDRILIVPGGGISERNLPRILRECPAKEFHVSASTHRDSRMEFRNTRVPMGRTLSASEFTITAADEHRVRRFRGIAG